MKRIILLIFLFLSIGLILSFSAHAQNTPQEEQIENGETETTDETDTTEDTETTEDSSSQTVDDPSTSSEQATGLEAIIERCLNETEYSGTTEYELDKDSCKFEVVKYANDLWMEFYFILDKSKDYRIELSHDNGKGGTGNDDFLMQGNIDDYNDEDVPYGPVDCREFLNHEFDSDGDNSGDIDVKNEIPWNADKGFISNCRLIELEADLEEKFYVFKGDLAINGVTGAGLSYNPNIFGLEDAWNNPNCKVSENGCPEVEGSSENDKADDDDIEDFLEERSKRAAKNPFDITGDYDFKLKEGETGSGSKSIVNIHILPILPPGPCAEFADDLCVKTYSAIGDITINPESFVGFLLSFFLSISGVVLLVILVRSGYQIMTARGNEEAIKEAKESITSAIVGLLFIIFALVIVQVITVDILNLPGFGE